MPLSPSVLRSIMAAHFAGSASVSDRRRRRLAQETDRTRPLPTAGLSGRASRSGSSEDHSSDETVSITPVSKRTIIPRDGRILGLFCALNLFAWGIVLWLGLSSWAENRGLEQLTTLKDGPVLRYFSTIQLLAASQLCFLIYWHRSRSRKDFMGRYRIWSWAGLFWGGVCFSLAAHIDYHFMSALLERFSLDAWRPETICWLLPLSVGVISLYRVLRREMRYSSASLLCWEISFGLGVLSALMALGFENLLPETVRHAVNVSVWSLWLVSVSTTYLIHLRYVVHVSNEAAPRIPSRGTRLMRWSQRGMTKVGERVLASRPRYRRKLKELSDVQEDGLAAKPSSRRAPQAKKSDSPAANRPVEATVDKKPVREKNRPVEKVKKEPVSTDETPKTRSVWNWLPFGRKKDGETVQLKPPVKSESVVPAPQVAPVAKSASSEKPRVQIEKVKKEPVSTDGTPKTRSAWNWLPFGRKKDGGTVRLDAPAKSKSVVPAPHVAPVAKLASSEKPRVQEKSVEKPAPVVKSPTTSPAPIAPKPVVKSAAPVKVAPVPVVESKPVPPPAPAKAPVKPVVKAERREEPDEDDLPSREIPKSSPKPSYDYDMDGESDLDLDEDDFSSLSSKERKKLKKLRKQQARAQK